MRCEICGSLEITEIKKLNGDHDHETGIFRGWLCTSCNIGLGLFKDSPARLISAAVYLKKHGKVVHEYELSRLWITIQEKKEAAKILPPTLQKGILVREYIPKKRKNLFKRYKNYRWDRRERKTDNIDPKSISIKDVNT